MSSHLREKDGDFRWIDRLSDCISYVMDTYHPKCVWIVSSCVAGVIGDDIEQEAKRQKPLMAFLSFPCRLQDFWAGSTPMPTIRQQR